MQLRRHAAMVARRDSSPACWSRCSPSFRAQPAPSDEAAVLAADESLGDAMRGGDKSVARKLLSLQFTFVDEDGKLHERKEFLGRSESVGRRRRRRPKVKIYGRVGMVTGHRKSAHGHDVFFLDIWAKQKGAWRVLVMQDVVLAAADAPPSDAPSRRRALIGKAYECKNPCQTIPYRVRSPAEQDIVNTFQAIEKAAVAHDADDMGKAHRRRVRALRHPAARRSRSRTHRQINRQKESNTAVMVGEVQTMRLSVYGDGAAMIAATSCRTIRGRPIAPRASG